LLHPRQYVFLSLGVSFPCLFHQAAFRFWFAKGYAYLFSISTLFDYSSTNVPVLLKALGHPVEIKIPETDFDSLFVVTPKADAPPTVLRLRY
jgi:hypothetical protein